MGTVIPGIIAVSVAVLLIRAIWLTGGMLSIVAELIAGILAGTPE